MNKHIAYGGGVVAAAVALSGLGAGGAGALATGVGWPTGHAAVTTGAASAVPGTQLWVQRYNGPANGDDRATSVAVSPSGGTVYVTGSRAAANGYSNYATVAYNAATGARLWENRYNGPANRYDDPSSVAVSPSGSTVFVTGTSYGGASRYDYATVAYNAATGAQRWVHRCTGPANGIDEARSVAVSPSGGTVFVTGASFPVEGIGDYATVAYNASTGAQRWVHRYNGPANGDDQAWSMAVSPSGSTVFVTGTSYGNSSPADYATVAYNASTGAERWVHRYNGPANGQDKAWSVAVSPAGGTVFVTGYSHGAASGYDYATVAYSAATGAQMWVRRYNGPANGNDVANSVAVSPTGGTVFVTGYSFDKDSRAQVTVAYNAATGAQAWVQRNVDGGGGVVAVSPNGSTVYVTGSSYSTVDYVTVACNAATGAQLWENRYNGPANGLDNANSVAVSPDGARVFITGSSQGTAGSDYATIAYSG
jgi:DNA-binding beta-propeller fold protein YncE